MSIGQLLGIVVAVALCGGILVYVLFKLYFDLEEKMDGQKRQIDYLKKARESHWREMLRQEQTQDKLLEFLKLEKQETSGIQIRKITKKEKPC